MLIESSAGKSTGSAGLRARLEERIEALAEQLESRYGLVLMAFSALYLFRFIAFDDRPFWYDEYFTLAVAQLKSFGEMWSALKDGLDLNPPLSHWITHISMALFGQNELAARLPASLGFLAFALFGYGFVARRCGKLAGMNAALLIATTAPVTIIGQARPYGILLAFAGLALFSWQSVCAGIRRGLYLPLLALSLCGALLCHCYAFLLFVPLMGAELTRSVVRKKVDWAVLAAMVAAVPTVAFYIPVLSALKRFVPESVFTTSWTCVPDAYAFMLYDGWKLMVVAAIVPGLLQMLHPRISPVEASEVSGFRLYETVLLGLVSSVPIVGVVLSYFLRSPWSERYALAALFGICGLVAASVHFSSHRRLAEVVVLLTLLGGFFIENRQPMFQLQAEVAMRPLTRLPKEVLDRAKPFVISNGILMKQADYYEPAESLANVYYLVDRAASEKYTGALVFDQHFRLFQQYGALRSHLAEYSAFTSAHKSFYLYGPLAYHDDWLIKKLTDDGAIIRVLRKDYFPPNPETERLIPDAFLCEVSMR
jgi:hypothetical protein